jgi:uncharacterized membrane protein
MGADGMKEPQYDLEAKMQKISLGTSLLGLGLMVFGFIALLVQGNSLSIPGVAALSIQTLHTGAQISPALLAMTAGIGVLALIPILRVLLALLIYLWNHQVLNVVVALIVFIELIVSIRIGG